MIMHLNKATVEVRPNLFLEMTATAAAQNRVSK